MKTRLFALFISSYSFLLAHSVWAEDNVINLDDVNPPQKVENVYGGECGGTYYQIAWMPNPDKSEFGWYAVNGKRMDPSQINLFLKNNNNRGFISDVDVVACGTDPNVPALVFRISLLKLKEQSPEISFVKLTISEDGKTALSLD